MPDPSHPSNKIELLGAPVFAPFEGWGYEKYGDTLFPNFENGTAIEVKIV